VAAAAETEDGRFLVIDGRQWRATDPAIPDSLRTELVAELMDARRPIRGADDAATRRARARVQNAKVALGERGEPWWEAPSELGRRTRLAATMRALLQHRDPEKTICPSDAARVVGGPDWRSAMEAARSVAAELAEAGVLEVRQRGVPVDIATARGPIRLGRGPAWPG